MHIRRPKSNIKVLTQVVQPLTFLDPPMNSSGILWLVLAVWSSGNVMSQKQSYSMLSPISTEMGDCL